MSLERRSGTSVDGAVDVRSVLDLDGLLLALDQSPELGLDIVLRDDDVADPLSDPVLGRAAWLLARDRVVGEPVLAERRVALLEASDAVLIALVMIKGRVSAWSLTVEMEQALY